jgi:hypothetical protein
VRAPLHFHPVGSSRIPVTSFFFPGLGKHLYISAEEDFLC